MRPSLGLRAVLKKDKPLSSVLLFLRARDGGAAPVEDTPTLDDLKLVMDELLLELLPTPRCSAEGLVALPSALPAPPDLDEGGPVWLAFLSAAAVVRGDSRLAFLSAALVLADDALRSAPALGEGLR